MMGALDEFDVLATLCFTPPSRGMQPHHTSPPLEPGRVRLLRAASGAALRMRFYADVLGSERPGELLDQVERALVAGLDRDTPTVGRIEAVREALIAAGMLEQGVADCLGDDTAGDAEPGRAAAALTDAAAEILACLARGEAADPVLPSELGQARAALRGHGPLAIVHPEGYLFYALFPDLYIELGAAIGAAIGGASAVVIGVRSIGTSLSAAVAAGLSARGCAVQRHTVRPVGEPFERVTIPSDWQRAAWRSAARHGAAFIAVDEGPGLSGSSLASVIAALESLEVDPDLLHIACAAPPATPPMASPAVRAIWRRTRCWPAQGPGAGFWARTLPSWLATADGVRSPAVDLSWGAWIGHLPDRTPPPMPQLERRKLLLGDGDRRVLAKFAGFGAPGRRKALHLAALADAGMVPRYLGQAHGMVLQEWIEGSVPPGLSDHAPLKAAAAYYAFLRRSFAVADVPDTSALAETVEEIAGNWFGATLPGDLRPLLARMRDVRAIEGDQRPEPVEWRAVAGRILKTDAADHYLDHTWARRMDVAFDLAGFSLEFRLSKEAEGELLRRYAVASDDPCIGTRMPFFRAAYAAHRLATADTAYHAGGGSSAALDHQRRRMADGLATALRGDRDAECG